MAEPANMTTGNTVRNLFQIRNCARSRKRLAERKTHWSRSLENALGRGAQWLLIRKSEDLPTLVRF